MLKTNCNGCAFLCGETCLFNKTIFFHEEDGYCTEGFCHDKRNRQWLTKAKTQDIPSLANKITEEETEFAVNIAVLDDSLHNFNKTISILKSCKNVKEIIIGISPNSAKLTKDILEVLKDIKVCWSLYDIKNEECNTVSKIYHYIAQFVKKPWILMLESGDVVEPKDIEKAALDISNSNTNYILYNLYLSPEQNTGERLLINTTVFRQLGGNNQKDIVEKIKEFPNWQTTCLNI